MLMHSMGARQNRLLHYSVGDVFRSKSSQPSLVSSDCCVGNNNVYAKSEPNFRVTGSIVIALHVFFKKFNMRQAILNIA